VISKYRTVAIFVNRLGYCPVSTDNFVSFFSLNHDAANMLVEASRLRLVQCLSRTYAVSYTENPEA
jgi:hypothetical protein